MRPYRSIAVLIATTTLAGCAAQRTPVIVTATTPPPPVALAQAPAAPAQLTAINRNLTTSAAIWHVRAALNVAALACRGASEATIVARYNALLTANAQPLKSAEAALAAEFRAGGGDWRDRYDDAMTRLYNFFSQSQGRARLCATAEAALADAPTVPEALPAYAQRWLADLDAPFAPAATPMPMAQPATTRQVIAIAAAPVSYGARTVQPVPAPAPRLTLDLSALPRD